MVTQPALNAEEFAQLTRELLAAETVAEILEKVVTVAQDAVPGAALVSITLRTPDGRFHTPVKTDPVAIALDEIQYQTGEGPCVDAARQEGPAYAHSANLAEEPAWPRFGPQAAKHGFCAVLSTALLPDARPPRLSGALNVYAREPGALAESSRQVTLLLATHASLALAGTEAVSRAELRASQLRQAIDTRDVIGQAKGILMQRRGISADEAFDILRQTSQDLNIKLTEVAKALTERRVELDGPVSG